MKKDNADGAIMMHCVIGKIAMLVASMPADPELKEYNLGDADDTGWNPIIPHGAALQGRPFA